MFASRQPGFSLHAATCCEAKQRDKLEKLCRYITRFHGVFAPNCKLREHIVPRHQPTAKAPDKPLAPMTWMQRLKRVFSIDIETCPKCGGKLRVIACIEDPDIIAKILEHIRTRDESQPSQPRAPPLRTELPTSVHQDRLF